MADTEALRLWVETITGFTSIWLNQNTPRPARPYATLHIMNQRQVGQPYTGPITALGVATIQAQYEITVSIQIYGSSTAADPRTAINAAYALRQSLDRPSIRESLGIAGWAFRAEEQIADVPEMLDSAWEPRAFFDAVFGMTVEQTDNLGYVETVEVTGTMGNGAGSSVSETVTLEN